MVIIIAPIKQCQQFKVSRSWDKLKVGRFDSLKTPFQLCYELKCLKEQVMCIVDLYVGRILNKADILIAREKLSIRLNTKWIWCRNSVGMIKCHVLQIYSVW